MNTNPIESSKQGPAGGNGASPGNLAESLPGNSTANQSGHPHAAGRPHAMDEHAIPTDLPRPHTFVVIAAAFLFVVLLAGLFIVGWLPHHAQSQEIHADAAERASEVPVVQVARPVESAGTSMIYLPCDITPEQQTSIFPRTDGYLKKLYVDIQDHVEAGQLLAEIDTPEVDAQLVQSAAALDQAKANVAKAQADEELAKRTLERYKDAAKDDSGAVAVQLLDQTQAAYEDAVAATASAKASVGVAQADVQRLTVLQGFEKVVAPFSGTITTRNYDLGALLSSTGGGKEIFTLVNSDPLRVLVNVPQVYAHDVKAGQDAFLTVRNFPGKEFHGEVARIAGAIDPTTRTMLFELHFPNHDGALYSGMYGQARLGITQQHKTLTIASSALIFNADGVQAATVRDGKIHLQKVSVGRDLGTELEILAGLNPDDNVVTSPDGRLQEGVAVQSVPDKSAAAVPAKTESPRASAN